MRRHQLKFLSTFGLQKAKTVGLVSTDLMIIKASSCLVFQLHVFLELINSQRRLESSVIQEENFPSWFAIPISLLNSVTLVGAFIFLMASVLVGSGEIPSLLCGLECQLITPKLTKH